MSEYQYYEFRAIDRPLTEQEIKELCRLSSRAEITPTSFVNTYNWGNFKGDPVKLMERYFDAFVYVANWGTRELMLRVPSRFLTPSVCQEFYAEETLTMWESGENVIICFRAAEEEPHDWEEGEGWMASLIQIRNDLLAGDLRPLYLGWLRDIQDFEFDEEEAEGPSEELAPLPPPGLRTLTAPLSSLVEFLGIDEDLIAAAALNSPSLESIQPSRAEIARWICGLPEAEKNGLLVDALAQDNPHFRHELLLRFKGSSGASDSAAGNTERRTVAQLLGAAARCREERRREQQERARIEKERKEREAAIARAKYLDGLRPRQAEIWIKINSLAGTKRAQDYDAAVGLLKDLSELSQRDGNSADFQLRLRRIQENHIKKPSFLRRLTQAGLVT